MGVGIDITKKASMEIREEERNLSYPVGRRRSVSQGLWKKKKTNISKLDNGRYVFYLSSFSCY